MSYKTVVLDHASKTKDMASAVEHKANEMAEKGLISDWITRCNMSQVQYLCRIMLFLFF